jgi:hypothetical protein
VSERNNKRDILRRCPCTLPNIESIVDLHCFLCTLSPKDEVAAKFGRRTTEDAAQAARERYLARKRERKGQPKPVMD